MPSSLTRGVFALRDCELVVDIETETRVGAEALERQFARTPFAASFRSGETPFVLVTLHVLYGEEGECAKELAAIARWLAQWGERDEEWRQNLLALGDFTTSTACTATS